MISFLIVRVKLIIVFLYNNPSVIYRIIFALCLVYSFTISNVHLCEGIDEIDKAIRTLDILERIENGTYTKQDENFLRQRLGDMDNLQKELSEDLDDQEVGDVVANRIFDHLKAGAVDQLNDDATKGGNG